MKSIHVIKNKLITKKLEHIFLAKKNNLFSRRNKFREDDIIKNKVIL